MLIHQLSWNNCGNNYCHGVIEIEQALGGAGDGQSKSGMLQSTGSKSET